jgi:hypothetical protein
MTHTPGPWNVSEHSELPDRHYEITTPECSIADVGTEDDAKLIGSLPELLAALKAANKLLWKEGFTTSEPVVAQIETIIAKATGTDNA